MMLPSDMPGDMCDMPIAAADRGRYGNARNAILKAIFVALHKAELHYTLPRVAEASHSERLGGPRGAGNRAWENTPQQDAAGTGPTAQTMLAAQQAGFSCLEAATFI